jgi:pimeloyl-ACP methyl ester carboxylesterase
MANWQALADYRSRAQPIPATQPPACARMGMIDVPTCILVGDADVPDILASADMLVSAIPVAKKEVVAGAGHMLAMEQPAHFVRSVHRFLQKHLKPVLRCTRHACTLRWRWRTIMAPHL